MKSADPNILSRCLSHTSPPLDQVGSIRQHLADIYEREQNWRWAAEVLVGIPLETGQKQYTVDYKLETYLKIARLYLEDDDPTQGEAYINRAAQLQTQTKNAQLQVVYKVSERWVRLPDCFSQECSWSP